MRLGGTDELAEFRGQHWGMYKIFPAEVVESPVQPLSNVLLPPIIDNPLRFVQVQYHFWTLALALAGARGVEIFDVFVRPWTKVGLP